MIMQYKSKKTKKKLFEQIKFNTSVSDAIDISEIYEPNRGRWENREVFVYNDLYEIDEEKFKGIKEIIKVVRTTYKSRYSDEAPSIEVSYYISSKNLSAKDYNSGIRKHWLIENSLHYVKDVTLKEDASLIRSGNAPANFSIARNIVVNAFRMADFTNMAQAIRLVGGDIKTLASLLE